jgi:hypothetical protein
MTMAPHTSQLPQGFAAMISTSIWDVAAIAATSGVAVHIAVLRPFEVEYFMYRLLGSLSLVCFLLSTAYYTAGFTILEVVMQVSVIAMSFNAGLFTSMITYRIFFHRLGHFPGPFGAKVTRFWSAWITAREVKYHKEVAQMHQKYGDFVRTGT